MTNYWWPLMGESVSQEERAKLARFIISAPRLTYGEEIKKFERQWSEWNGVPHSLFVNSGTSADYLIIAACKHFYDWPDGTEVLVPAVTWGSVIASIINNGLKPVFVDLDPGTLAMDIEDVRRKTNWPYSRAIFPTHCLGIPNNLAQLETIAVEQSQVLLEDCCEAHGALWQGKRVGSIGDASSFSFFWGHHMTTLEGGMVCTSNPALADIMLSMRNHGMTRDMGNRAAVEADSPDVDSRFTFATAGFNFRNTEMHALLGQMQLQGLDAFIAQRNRNFALFSELSQKYEAHFRTFQAPAGATVSSFCLPFLFHKAETRQQVLQGLEENGIETRPLISGNLVRQPFIKEYLEKTGQAVPHLPGCEAIHQGGMYIGNSQFVNEEHIHKLDELLQRFLG